MPGIIKGYRTYPHRCAKLKKTNSHHLQHNIYHAQKYATPRTSFCRTGVFSEFYFLYVANGPFLAFLYALISMFFAHQDFVICQHLTTLITKRTWGVKKATVVLPQGKKPKPVISSPDFSPRTLSYRFFPPKSFRL